MSCLRSKLLRKRCHPKIQKPKKDNSTTKYLSLFWPRVKGEWQRNTALRPEIVSRQNELPTTPTTILCERTYSWSNTLTRLRYTPITYFIMGIYTEYLPMTTYAWSIYRTFLHEKFSPCYQVFQQEHSYYHRMLFIRKYSISQLLSQCELPLPIDS